MVEQGEGGEGVVMARQFVYRQERSGLFAVPAPDGCEFRFCRSAVDGFKILGLLYREFGLLRVVKILAKLATSRRALYVVMRAGRIVSYGHVSYGFCRHYNVESDSVVIGPVETVTEFRGVGLATFGLQRALDELVRADHRVFWIDTGESNAGMQRVIEKCGFRHPVGELNRLRGS